MTSLGGLEPPTFRLTAERANRLRHRDEFFTQRVACSKETRIIFIVFIRDLVFYVQIYFCGSHKLVSLYRNPRWSSGQDFALSPRRPGFDSPLGNFFSLRFFPLLIKAR